MCPKMLSRASAEMTGPMSVASRSGLPTESSASAPPQHLYRTIGDLILQAKQAQGRAALTGGVEGRYEDIGHDLLGQGGGVDHHRIQAARLGHEGNRSAFGAQAFGQRPLDEARHLGRPGEHDGGAPAVGHERGSHLTGARYQLDRARRDARLMEYLDRAGGDQRRFFGRLRQNRITDGESR